jgi:hypothetical protein
MPTLDAEKGEATLTPHQSIGTSIRLGPPSLKLIHYRSLIQTRHLSHATKPRSYLFPGRLPGRPDASPMPPPKNKAKKEAEWKEIVRPGLLDRCTALHCTAVLKERCLVLCRAATEGWTRDSAHRNLTHVSSVCHRETIYLSPRLQPPLPTQET